MLKIPKGLKKKKKGKKKKDQELFTEEELEQYKAEQAKKAAEAAAAAAAAAQAGAEKPAENDEEWKKFAALTSGVDAIVKKTHDDLDRIKETSFFQRVPPKIETENAEPEEDEETKNAREVEALKNAVVELSESEYEESDDDTSFFDTDYMDKVGAAELPLAYIPDSPELEQAEGDDPFDTAYADKVITGPQVSKSGKKIVAIGSEVLQVLTGAVDNIPKSTITKRPKRRGIKNLMLSSFDQPDDDDEVRERAEEPKHDLLDDLLELPPEDKENVEIDLAVSLHVKFKENNPEEQTEAVVDEKSVTDDVLKEFDVLKEEDDEFAQLASESLSKPMEASKIVVDVVPLVVPPPQPETTDWAEFERTEADGQPAEEDEFAVPDDDDPFNTTFAEAVLPKVDSFEELAMESLTKKTETKAPPPPRPGPPPARPAAPPARPAPPVVEIHESNLMDSDEEAMKRDELARRKSSLSLSINAKAVQFAVPTPDPMKSDIEFSALIKKPLTPYYAAQEKDEEAPEDVDPFDTSFVPNVAPSKLELNYIEKDLLKTTINDLEDDDFDPRAVTPVPVEPAVPETVEEPVKVEEKDPFGNAIFDEDKYQALAVIDDASKEVAPADASDILTYSTLDATVDDAKVLTPQVNLGDSFEVEDIDPFDTTFADIRPGEAEIKIIESELIS